MLYLKSVGNTLAKKKDNSTLDRKKWLRRRVMREAGNCHVMETHGGRGVLYQHCYADCLGGVVIEKDEGKAASLVVQRPHWLVYCHDSEQAIAAGAGSSMPIKVLDCDPYGSPWPVLSAFFNGEREFQPEMHVVVNDGVRASIKIRGAAKIESVKDLAMEYGSNIYQQYIEACQIKMGDLVAVAGYKIAHWFGYYCGHNNDMTHYWAALKRTSP
jgi:hypothetical protein